MRVKAPVSILGVIVERTVAALFKVQRAIMTFLKAELRTLPEFTQS